jgi:hypothetical protein
VVYDRTFDGKPFDFGVKGVEGGALLLYDAQTHSLWSQLFGEAVSGKMAGRALTKIPSTLTTWKQWRTLHPRTTVYVKPSEDYVPSFTRETFERMARSGEGPLRPEDLIVGLEGHVEARAYLVRRLARDGRIQHDELEGKPILVYLGNDLATAKAYRRTVDGRVLTFERSTDERLRDVETGSLWDPWTGKALSGPLAGRRLAPIITTQALWFAWHKYRPDTIVHGEPLAPGRQPAKRLP